MQDLKWFISDGLDNFDESVKVSEIWEKLDELIKKERQQICDANNRGFKVGRKNIAETANDYYEETYIDSNQAGI